jgi:glycosyltransferase involved in cell wall biosynthesis
MKKNIWIFNHYATNMYKDHGGRHYWFADNLYKNGYIPTIFCSNQIHKTNDYINLNKKKYIIKNNNKFSFIFVKSSPYKSNGLSRILNMFTFYKNLFSVTKNYVKQYEKPDIILASSVHPLTLLAGIKIARRYKIPCICEIRDLWPESIFEYGSLKKHSLIGELLQLGEKWIYKKANKLIFTMPGGYDYIIDQNWQHIIPKEKCFNINNGIDFHEFDYNKENYIIEDEDLENNNIFKIIYTGSIQRVNNLKIIVDVAKELKEYNKIKILIWGIGNELEELREYVKTEHLPNIIFKGYVEKRYIPYILSKANLNLLHCEYTSLLKYGISHNKNFEYLTSGNPILSTIKSNYDIVVENNIGSTVEIQTIDNIKNAILDFYSMIIKHKELYDEMRLNARKTAEEYDFKVLTKKLINIIEK